MGLPSFFAETRAVWHDSGVCLRSPCRKQGSPVVELAEATPTRRPENEIEHADLRCVAHLCPCRWVPIGFPDLSRASFS